MKTNVEFFTPREQASIAQDIRAMQHARTPQAVESIARAMQALGRFTELARQEFDVALERFAHDSVWGNRARQIRENAGSSDA